MKKLSLAAFLLGSGLIAALCTTSIAFLTQLNQRPLGLDMAQLAQGKFLQIIQLKEFWMIFPTFPTVSQLFQPASFVLMVILQGVILYFLDYRNKYSPLLVSCGLLLSALIPWVIGQMALVGNVQPEIAGTWLAFMVTGIIYAAATSVIFSGVHIFRIQ